MVEATARGGERQASLLAIRENFLCALGLAAQDAALLIKQLEKLSLALSSMTLDARETALHGQSALAEAP
ncbi:MAG: hypothetical protein FGM40_00040 [Rhodocyclaceae bacterium]|nr:hypothetical protein [Rhodocyclaceae bacterium]